MDNLIPDSEDASAAPRAPKTRAILTEEQAVSIYQLKDDESFKNKSQGARAAAIADMFGISEKTVRDIWSRRTWLREMEHAGASGESMVRSLGTRKRRHESTRVSASEESTTDLSPTSGTSAVLASANTVSLTKLSGAEMIEDSQLYAAEDPYTFSPSHFHTSSLIPQSPGHQKFDALTPHTSYSKSDQPQQANTTASLPLQAPPPPPQGHPRPAPPPPPQQNQALPWPRPATPPDDALPQEPRPDDPFHDDWPHWDRPKSPPKRPPVPPWN